MASAICTEFGARKVIAAATVPSATRRLKFTAASWGSPVQEPGPGSETETIAVNIRCAVAKSADLKNTQPTRTARHEHEGRMTDSRLARPSPSPTLGFS